MQRSPWLKQLPEKVQLALFYRCNRSWKRVLAYIAAVGSSTHTDDRFSVGQVSSGQYHNVAVTTKGAVYTFGGTEEGCLGRGSVNGGGNVARLVPGLRRVRVSQVGQAWINSTPEIPPILTAILRLNCSFKTFGCLERTIESRSFDQVQEAFIPNLC